MALCSQLENGCAGVFVFAVNSRSPKVELNIILNPSRNHTNASLSNVKK
jgi:hypothetical protein